MSLNRAKRVVDASAIAPFEWTTTPAGATLFSADRRDSDAARVPEMPAATLVPEPAAPPPPPPSAPVPEPADLAQQHSTRLAELERDAFAKGFAQGERAGAEAAAERGEAMLRRLTQTIEELTMLRSQMIHATERQMVQLALAVARRIVHREVSLDQDLLIAMARVALERLGESARVTVRLHPEEFEATAAARAAEWTGTSVDVVADARVGRGGCRVESEFGMIDAGVDAQIQELARALLGEETGA
jgi:flagellar assembly protein FliH